MYVGPSIGVNYTQIIIIIYYNDISDDHSVEVTTSVSGNQEISKSYQPQRLNRILTFLYERFMYYIIIFISNEVTKKLAATKTTVLCKT